MLPESGKHTSLIMDSSNPQAAPSRKRRLSNAGDGDDTLSNAGDGDDTLSNAGDGDDMLATLGEVAHAALAKSRPQIFSCKDRIRVGPVSSSEIKAVCDGYIRQSWVLGRRNTGEAATFAWWLLRTPFTSAGASEYFIGSQPLGYIFRTFGHRLQFAASHAQPTVAHAELGNVHAASWTDAGDSFCLAVLGGRAPLQLLDDSCVAALRVTGGAAQVQELLVKGRAWVLGRRPAVAPGKESATSLDTAQPYAWWVLPLSWQSASGTLRIGSRTALAVYSGDIGKSLRATSGPTVTPIALHPELGIRCAWREWRDAGSDFCLVHHAASAPPRAPPLPPFRQLLDMPQTARLPSPACAAGVEELAKKWLLGRRPTLSTAAGAAAAGPQDDEEESGGGAAAPSESPAAEEWWVVADADLQETRVRLGDASVRPLYKRLALPLRSAPDSSVASHPALGLPAVWRSWVDGDWEWELVLPRLHAAALRWGKHQLVLGVRPTAQAQAAAVAVNAAATAGARAEAAAATPDAPAGAAAAVARAEAAAATVGAQAAGASEGSDVAADPVEVPLLAAQSPPVHEAVPYQWHTLRISTLRSPGMCIGTACGSAVHQAVNRLQIGLWEGRLAPTPFPALPGSPPALVKTWVDGSFSLFIAVVNPAPRRRKQPVSSDTTAAAEADVSHAAVAPDAAPRRRRRRRVSALALADAMTVEQDSVAAPPPAPRRHKRRRAAAALAPILDTASDSEHDEVAGLPLSFPPAAGEAGIIALRSFLAEHMPERAGVSVAAAAAAAAGGGGGNLSPPSVPGDAASEPRVLASGLPGTLPPPPPPPFGWHQWVLGRRDQDASPAPPYDWIALTSTDVMHRPDVRIGKAHAWSIYTNVGGRIRKQLREGSVAPTPFAELPGAPPALVAEWADGGFEYFFALVNPITDAGSLLRFLPRKLQARGAKLRGDGNGGGGAEGVGPSPYGAFRAWLARGAAPTTKPEICVTSSDIVSV